SASLHRSSRFTTVLFDVDRTVPRVRAGIHQESAPRLFAVGNVRRRPVPNDVADRTLDWAEMEQTRGGFVSRTSFLTRTTIAFARTLSDSLVSEKFARKAGFLQSLDPRVRVLGVLALVVAAVACRKIQAVAILFLIATLIAILSSLDLVSLAKRVWIAVL